VKVRRAKPVGRPNIQERRSGSRLETLKVTKGRSGQGGRGGF
jgi:hypothetical protein